MSRLADTQTKTLAISFAALFLVLLLYLQTYLGLTSNPTTSVLVTFQEGNFTTHSVQNIAITESSYNDGAKHSQSSLDNGNKFDYTDWEEVGDDSFVEIEYSPRVALLYLTVGEIHNEPVWRAFFEAAGRLKFRFQPPTPVNDSYVFGKKAEHFQKISKSGRELEQAESVMSIMDCDDELAFLKNEVERILHGTDEDNDVISKQQLFSVYTHPPQGYSFPEKSIFRGTEVEERADTSHAWASFNLVDAEILLLRAALTDKFNQKFILLSESCSPIHRPEIIYLNLLSEKLSRMDACFAWTPTSMLSRWDGRMQTKYLSAANWRKSSQFFCLNRRHAEIIGYDVHVRKMFESYCTMRDSHRCVPDEHYIPTALSVYGVDNETDCIGSVTATYWPTGGRLHPVSFPSKNVNSILFKKLRHLKTCQVGTAQASAMNIFYEKRDIPRCLMLDTSVLVDEPKKDSENWILDNGYKPLDYGCSMFARKFAKETIGKTLKTSLSCSGVALGYWC